MTEYTPSRRHVLKWTGVAATLAIGGSLLPNFGISAALAADLGAGDIGVLNYAYALEQLEAAFYTPGRSRPPIDGITKYRTGRPQGHPRPRIAHRNFLKKALGKKAIPGLEVDFSARSTSPAGRAFWARPTCSKTSALPPITAPAS